MLPRSLLLRRSTLRASLNSVYLDLFHAQGAAKQNIHKLSLTFVYIIGNIKTLARTAKVCSMSKSVITVTVKLFAAYQEAFRVSELVLEFPNSMPVKAVCDRLIAEHPELSQWRDITRFGINLIFVEPDTLLQDGDEVVLIPPVSGG